MPFARPATTLRLGSFLLAIVLAGLGLPAKAQDGPAGDSSQSRRNAGRTKRRPGPRGPPVRREPGVTGPASSWAGQSPT